VLARSTRDARTLIKARGAHETPTALAAFLAEQVVVELGVPTQPLRILDPACGGGALLHAVAHAAPLRVRRNCHLIGVDTHGEGVAQARRLLRDSGAARVSLETADFLLQDARAVDVVIANPPYVRTQVLGAERSRRLARRYGLTGRVDLYHAFLKAIAAALTEGGVLGLLTSNRFLVTQAGAGMRETLQRDFEIVRVIDLGDTRLFSAAVLPAIVIAHRVVRRQRPARGAFVRVYARTDGDGEVRSTSILAALANGNEGTVRVDDTYYEIERGILRALADAAEPWMLASEQHDPWTDRVAAHTACRFGDVAQVRVGIKTTADAVFIRDDWDSLPEALRPEPELLWPLLTHHVAARWTATGRPRARVLYPYDMSASQRTALDLDAYPRARAYLESHGAALRARKYLASGGRRWYEIWVPQRPAEWAQPKLVFPDISQTPRFFLDRSGAVVNGDCYWITLRPGVDESWLYLMLAIANSRFIERYYDRMFNNRLYSGRRRFLTQYVAKFPLPHLHRAEAMEAVALAKAGGAECVDALVERLFGLKLG
jgi:adenine-specific DNA-methyltransferase